MCEFTTEGRESEAEDTFVAMYREVRGIDHGIAEYGCTRLVRGSD